MAATRFIDLFIYLFQLVDIDMIVDSTSGQRKAVLLDRHWLQQ